MLEIYIASAILCFVCNFYIFNKSFDIYPQDLVMIVFGSTFPVLNIMITLVWCLCYVREFYFRKPF